MVRRPAARQPPSPPEPLRTIEQWISTDPSQHPPSRIAQRSRAMMALHSELFIDRTGAGDPAPVGFPLPPL